MAVLAHFADAHAAAAARLLLARGSVRTAFDDLNTGITFDDLTVYVERDFHARLVQEAALDLDRLHARLVGIIAATAITVVESDRAGRDA